MSGMGTPKIELSPAAAEALRSAGAGGPEGDVHLDIRPGGEHDLFLAPGDADEVRVESQGLAIWVRKELVTRADGIRIDYTATGAGEGFRIDDPSAPAEVVDIGPAELKRMLDAGGAIELLDVRTTGEIEIARIDGSRPLAPDLLDELAERGLEIPIVLYCHHGPRSRMAAMRLTKMGFKKVYNLAGGIDAWALSVDPNVRRY